MQTKNKKAEKWRSIKNNGNLRVHLKGMKGYALVYVEFPIIVHGGICSRNDQVFTIIFAKQVCRRSQNAATAGRIFTPADRACQPLEHWRRGWSGRVWLHLLQSNKVRRNARGERGVCAHILSFSSAYSAPFLTLSARPITATDRLRFLDGGINLWRR